MAVVLANKCENEKIKIYWEIENINMKFLKINFIEQNKDLPFVKSTKISEKIFYIHEIDS